MAYRQEVTNSNFPQGLNPAAHNQSIVTKKGFGPILYPAVSFGDDKKEATQNAQKSLNAMHISQSKQAAYSDKEAEFTRNR